MELILKTQSSRISVLGKLGEILAMEALKRNGFQQVSNLNREVAVDIGDSGTLPQKSDVLVDQRGAFRKQGDLKLRHGGHPVQVRRGGRDFRYHIEIRRSRKPAEP